MSRLSVRLRQPDVTTPPLYIGVASNKVFDEVDLMSCAVSMVALGRGRQLSIKQSASIIPLP